MKRKENYIETRQKAPILVFKTWIIDLRKEDDENQLVASPLLFQ